VKEAADCFCGSERDEIRIGTAGVRVTWCFPSIDVQLLKHLMEYAA
jgi:hypothetical protein